MSGNECERDGVSVVSERGACVCVREREREKYAMSETT